MAVEWVVLGSSLVQAVIRLAGHPNAADLAGNIGQGLQAVGRSPKAGDRLAAAVADQVEYHLRSQLARQNHSPLLGEFEAAIRTAVDATVASTTDPDVVRLAAVHPDDLLPFIRAHRGQRARVGLHSDVAVQEMYDKALDVATNQLRWLLTSNLSADVVAILRDLDGVKTDVNATRADTQRIEQLLQRAVPAWVDLVEVSKAGHLLTVAQLNPYRLGASATKYGDETSYANRDPYLLRTAREVDKRLDRLLLPGAFVLLVGPSKAGKTRTAFEALRRHATWHEAVLLAPSPGAAGALVRQTDLVDSAEPVVLWLDDLNLHLSGPNGLTGGRLSRFLERRGNTVVIATLRTEQEHLLTSSQEELSWPVRQLLNRAARVELEPTSADADEQAAAQKLYPKVGLKSFGLAEELAGAPALLAQYRSAKYANPVLWSVIAAAIDWTRVGMPPATMDVLRELAATSVADSHPHIVLDDQLLAEAIHAARTPPHYAGRIAAIQVVRGGGAEMSYRPFDYLVAADDQEDDRFRPVPTEVWTRAIRRIDVASRAIAVAQAALVRDRADVAMAAIGPWAESGIRSIINVARMIAYRRVLDPAGIGQLRHWFERAADTGSHEAMRALGWLLVEELDPPDLEGALHWYQRLADAGDLGGMEELAYLLAEQSDPPRIEEARHWYTCVAEAGGVNAMVKLGVLLVRRLQPPDIDGAYGWFTRAALALDSEAMFNLGVLLATRREPPDLEGARYWWQLAADAGDSDAKQALTKLFTWRDADGSVHVVWMDRPS